MKKISLIVLMIFSAILIFAFSGCGANETPNEDAEKADETAETVPPEQEETADLKELFEDKLSYLSSFGKLSFCGMPISELPSSGYSNSCISNFNKTIEPCLIETEGDYLDRNYTGTCYWSIDDFNKAALYLFNREIEFKYCTVESGVDLEKREVKVRFSYPLERNFRTDKDVITNISENDDGTYTVELYTYLKSLLDIPTQIAKWTALFSGREDGYFILRLDYNGKENVEFEPIGDEWLNEDSEKGWKSKIDRSSIKKGRFVDGDRVLIEIRPDHSGSRLYNYSEERHKIADMLEKWGYGRYDFRVTRYETYYILATLDQVKEIAKNLDFLEKIYFTDPHYYEM